METSMGRLQDQFMGRTRSQIMGRSGDIRGKFAKNSVNSIVIKKNNLNRNET